jgi:DNA polymerase III delta prime subunit
LEWRNADGRANVTDGSFELEGQDLEIAWERLEGRQPYALEPVTSVDDLVGRDEILQELVSLVCAESMGSAVISGQKRVGKTSIVKALESRLQAETAATRLCYLEVGPYGRETAPATFRALGRAICRGVSRTDQRFSTVSAPTFEDGSLSPLIDYFEEIELQAPEARMVVVLDEFDELPISVFRRDEVARSFFTTLRALSGLPHVAIILVGGERMALALSAHGDAINKFAPRQVDYFDPGQWNAFSELVRAPTRGILEITDDAVARLYEETAGHPPSF